MKHREYLDTARRHLTTCRVFFDNVNWEITPKKEELFKDWTRQLEEKESFYEKKVVFLMERITLLIKRNALTDERKECMQKKYDSLTKNIKLLEDVACLLNNSVMSLRRSDDLMDYANNSSQQMTRPLKEMADRLSGDITWFKDQRKNPLELQKFPQEENVGLFDEERCWLRSQKGLLKKTKESLEQLTSKFEEQTNGLERRENQFEKLHKRLQSSDSSLIDCECKLEERTDKLDKLNAIVQKNNDDISQQWEQLEEKKNLLENDIGLLKKQLKGIGDSSQECITWLKSQEKTLKKIAEPQDDNLLIDELEKNKALLEQNKNSLKEETEKLNESEKLFQGKYKQYKEQIKKKDYLLKDIYYLTGYILEALTIFAAYEGTTCGFDGNSINGFRGENIKDLDIQFTRGTHIDYYKIHKSYKKDKAATGENNGEENNTKWESNRNLPEMPSESDCDYEEKMAKFNKALRDLDSLNELITELKNKEQNVKQEIRENNETNHPNNSLEGVPFFHNVESHHFYEIITGVLNDPKIENKLLKKSENGEPVPLLSPDAEAPDKKVMTLIQKWKPCLRYSEKECKIWQDLEAEKALQKEPLDHLIKLCEDIFDRISKLG